MKRILIAIILFFVLVAFGIFWYFFGSTLLSLFSFDSSTNSLTDTPVLQEGPRRLTIQEQERLLQELAPENSIDTAQELQSEIEALSNLGSPQGTAESDLDLLNSLNQNASLESELDLLEQLAN